MQAAAGRLWGVRRPSPGLLPTRDHRSRDLAECNRDHDDRHAANTGPELDETSSPARELRVCGAADRKPAPAINTVCVGVAVYGADCLLLRVLAELMLCNA